MKRPEETMKNMPEDQFGCNISWVYGINTNGKNSPFLVLSETEIIYRVSSFVAFYNLETNTQSLIKTHEAEVDCFSYNKSSDILATVEKKPFPPINLWKKDPESE